MADEMRYAGVSSFGIGGTNCHISSPRCPTRSTRASPIRIAAEKYRAAAQRRQRQRVAAAGDDYAGALRENADASSLAFTALTRAVSISPSAWRRH